MFIQERNLKCKHTECLIISSAIRCGSSRHINKTGHSGGHNWSYYPGTLSSSRVKSLRPIWRSGTRKFHMWASGLQMSWLFESVAAYMVSYYSCQWYIPLPDGLKLWRLLQMQICFLIQISPTFLCIICSLMWRIYDGPEGTSLFLFSIAWKLLAMCENNVMWSCVHIQVYMFT